jgi:hypothetical protein
MFGAMIEDASKPAAKIRGEYESPKEAREKRGQLKPTRWRFIRGHYANIPLTLRVPRV